MFDLLGWDDHRGRNSPSPFNDIIESNLVIQRRTKFPHTWLWNKTIKTRFALYIETLNSYNTEFIFSQDGSWSTTMNVPDSITRWIFHGLALSEREGFGVAKPQELEVFKNIFAECHLPYSFRRQEQVSVACTVYNYNAATERVRAIAHFRICE